MHAQQKIKSLLDQLNTVIVGKESQVQDCVACLLAGGHLLIEDVPGVGKTTLAHALASTFGLLLTVKILLAISVAGHFVTAMLWRRRGTLNGRRSRRLHASVFAHVLAIVILAKAMFYLGH